MSCIQFSTGVYSFFRGPGAGFGRWHSNRLLNILSGGCGFFPGARAQGHGY
jgi:hypothetical protein